MYNIPMQLTEEKKSTRKSSDCFTCCEMCVFGSGVHSCGNCTCNHPIECHGFSGCLARVNATTFCGCLNSHDRVDADLVAIQLHNNGAGGW